VTRRAAGRAHRPTPSSLTHGTAAVCVHVQEKRGSPGMVNADTTLAYRFSAVRSCMLMDGGVPWPMPVWNSPMMPTRVRFSDEMASGVMCVVMLSTISHSMGAREAPTTCRPQVDDAGDAV
jgi:hypothetical protein